MGLVSRARDNVYNGENDLTQVYAWEVYTPEDDNGDWIYAGDPLVVVFVHTGCDVRGGYSAPIFCRSKGEYAVPVDYVAQFHAEAGRTDGREMDDDELRAIDERWCAGYSSLPASQVTGDIERVFPWTKTATSVCAKLKSGHIVKIGVEMPYLG